MDWKDVRIEKRLSGKHYIVEAFSPEGQQFRGGEHSLVVDHKLSGHVDDRRVAFEEIVDRLRQETLLPCPSDCDCRNT